LFSDAKQKRRRIRQLRQVFATKPEGKKAVAKYAAVFGFRMNCCGAERPQCGRKRGERWCETENDPVDCFQARAGRHS